MSRPGSPSDVHVGVLLEVAFEGGGEPGDVAVGDRLWTLDRGRLVETTVTAVSSRKTRAVVEVRTDAELVRYPQRYMDPRGEDMWARVMCLLEAIEGAMHTEDSACVHIADAGQE